MGASRPLARGEACTPAAQIAALAREKPAIEDLLLEWEAYLFRIQQAAGMTMVLATHEMGFAREAADKVCFMKDGKILEEAPASQFFDAPQHRETREFLARTLK